MYSSWVAACDPSSSVQWPYQLCEGHHVVSSNPTLVTWGLYWLHHTLLMKQNHHWASCTSSDKDTVPSDSLVFYCILWLCMVFWGFLNFGPSKSWLERKDEPNKRWRKRMEMEKASGQANKRKGLQTHQSADRQTNRQTDKRTDRQTDKQTNRQTDLNCCSKSSHSRKCKHDQTPANSISCDKHFCHMISLNQESVLKASKIPGRGSTLLGTQLYQAQNISAKVRWTEMPCTKRKLLEQLPRFLQLRGHVQVIQDQSDLKSCTPLKGFDCLSWRFQLWGSEFLFSEIST